MKTEDSIHDFTVDINLYQIYEFEDRFFADVDFVCAVTFELFHGTKAMIFRSQRTQSLWI